MIQRSLSLILLFLAILFPGYSDEVKSLALIPFEVRGNHYISKTKMQDFNEVLGEAMERAGNYRLIKATALSEVLKEEKFSPRNLRNPDNLAQFGEQTGADVVLMGTIINADGFLLISARLYKVFPSEVIGSVLEVPVDLNNFSTVADRFAKNILEVNAKQRPQVGSIGYVYYLSVPILEIREGNQAEGVLGIGVLEGITVGKRFSLWIPEKQKGKKEEIENIRVGDIRIDWVGIGTCSGKIIFDVNVPEINETLVNIGLARLTTGNDERFNIDMAPEFLGQLPGGTMGKKIPPMNLGFKGSLSWQVLSGLYVGPCAGYFYDYPNELKWYTAGLIFGLNAGNPADFPIGVGIEAGLQGHFFHTYSDIFTRPDASKNMTDILSIPLAVFMRTDWMVMKLSTAPTLIHVETITTSDGLKSTDLEWHGSIAFSWGLRL